MNCIGLDWDGVVSDYPSAFGFLVGLFDFCVIITVNHTITVDFASNILFANSGKIIVEVCPDDRIDDYPIWKAEMCERHKVNIMFDDNPDVVCACQKIGILAITVSEYIYRFQTPEVFWFQK